ncbi:hypothetical protein HanIR_Chr12g0582961 [Helianthus annuus]|nr:hypothetical protein HanIR_Chr12g0582961 [Helianthus annuus]
MAKSCIILLSVICLFIQMCLQHRDGRGLIQPFLEAVMLQEQWMYFFLAKLTCYMSIYIIVSVKDFII